MTITDPAIKAGDTIYALTSTGIRAVGTATTNGQATVTFTTDPAFVVAAVPRLGTVGGQGALKGSSVEVGVACAAGTRCTGTASLSVAVGERRGQAKCDFRQRAFRPERRGGPGTFAPGLRGRPHSCCAPAVASWRSWPAT